jgi:hypothetical protein
MTEKFEKLLYFASRPSEFGDEFDRVLGTLFESDQLERCSAPEEVNRCLARPGSTFRVALLVVADERELQQFYLMRQLLFDLHLLLLLPDHNEETLAVAHGLRPRFIGLVGRDHGVLEEVLRTTLQKKFIAPRTMDLNEKDVAFAIGRRACFDPPGKTDSAGSPKNDVDLRLRNRIND